MRSRLKLVGGELFANDKLQRLIGDFAASPAASPGDKGHGDWLVHVRVMLDVIKPMLFRL